MHMDVQNAFVHGLIKKVFMMVSKGLKLVVLCLLLTFAGASNAFAQPVPAPGQGPVHVDAPKDIKPVPSPKLEKDPKVADLKKEEVKAEPPHKIDKKPDQKPVVEKLPAPKPDNPPEIKPKDDKVAPAHEPGKMGKPLPKPEKEQAVKPIKKAPKPPRELTPEQKDCKIDRLACRQDCKAAKAECGNAKNCGQLLNACKHDCDTRFVCH